MAEPPENVEGGQEPVGEQAGDEGNSFLDPEQSQQLGDSVMAAGQEDGQPNDRAWAEAGEQEGSVELQQSFAPTTGDDPGVDGQRADDEAAGGSAGAQPGEEGAQPSEEGAQPSDDNAQPGAAEQDLDASAEQLHADAGAQPAPGEEGEEGQPTATEGIPHPDQPEAKDIGVDAEAAEGRRGSGSAGEDASAAALSTEGLEGGEAAALSTEGLEGGEAKGGAPDADADADVVPVAELGSGAPGGEDAPPAAAEASGTAEGDNAAEAAVASADSQAEGQAGSAEDTSIAPLAEGAEVAEGEAAQPLEAGAEAAGEAGSQTAGAEAEATPEMEAEDGRASLLAVWGLDTHRYNNALLVDEDTLVTCIASHLVFVSLSSGARRYLRGRDGGGVGAVAVHPSRTLLAVGEKARSGTGPCVYIYSYPELKCVKVLRAGTERAYSALAFDSKGDTLASVGSFPDFLLTLWDWRAESIVLRAKAFSQDVNTVAFSPYFEGQLTTSGQGHIRFWRMASTFTGLKLQGALGKFGNVELSDVAAFVELPDGKVLSTTESGELLLWDGGLIKVVLLRPGDKPCHDGAVEVLLHDRAAGVILSAGADGYVRLWDFNQVNDAEPREDGNSRELKPLDEVALVPTSLSSSGAEAAAATAPSAPVHVVSLVWEGRRWVAVDRGGAVYVVLLPGTGSISKGAIIQRVANHPAGALAGLTLSPRSHVALCASRDGQLRALDYRSGEVLAEAVSQQPITAFAAVQPPADTDAVAMTGIAGYRDGVVRVYTRCAAAAAGADPAVPPEPGTPTQGLALTGAAKPHKGAITALAVSRDASRVATCGEDGTVFFFDLLSSSEEGAAAAAGLAAGGGPGSGCGALKPRAYVRLAAGSGVLTCATWGVTGEVLLAGTSRGTILQVPLPPADLDTHHSYEWKDAVVRSYSFVVPKPKRPKKSKKGKGGKDAEGPEEEGVEDGEGLRPEGKGAAEDAQAGGGEAAEGQQEGEEGGKADDEVGKEEKEDDEDADGGDGLAASSGELLTLALAQDDPNTLLVTAGGQGHAARKVWRVTLSEPLAAPLLEGFPCAPVTHFRFSEDGLLALMGSADGLVRVQPLEGPYGPPSGPFWESPLHDMQTGRVTGVVVSYDGAYLLTAARDGAVHLLMLQLGGPLEPQEPEPEQLPQQGTLPAPVADVTSPSAYTLEEEKQQAERDQQVREAEEKKLSVRERLARIRSEFEALLSENEAQPEALRLSRWELEVDPGLRELMEAEALRREEVARLELAWESEKQRLGLAKLRSYFLDGVETERVVLYSLRHGSIVTTFRTAKLSHETRTELAGMRAMAALAAAGSVGGGGLDGSGRDTGGDARKGSDTGGGPGGDAAARARLAEATAALEEGIASGKLNKADLRRLHRKKREAEWAAFNATRPDETYDSPADLRAIEEARRTIGDFKLKSDPNFVVPEEERMTPQRKRHAMLELEEALYNIKHAFNQKFFALRDVKRKILVDVRIKLNALADLAVLASATAVAPAATGGPAAAAGAEAESTAAAYLAPFASIPPALLPEEQPAEAREAVTDEDLVAFAARKQEEERKAAAAAAGGLGGFATTGTKRPVAAAPAAGAGAPAAGGTGASGLSASEEALAKMMAAVPQSELEKGLAAYNRRRVEYMRSKLTDEVNAMIEAFDDAHAALKAEKLGLESDVKAGEMRLLVMHQELQLLREFDKRESVLLQKRQAKQDDKQEIVDKITECTDKLEQKRLELEGLIARRAAVVAELDAVVPESDPFREALVRVFHRRIKRSKKKAGGGDDDYDSEEDEDEDEMGDDEADDDDDGGEEVCPPGCDQSVYERVCDLREKRLDEEDMIAEFQKTIEVLRKEKEALAKKQRLVEQGLAAVNADMAEFQKEKQGRLNQVEVVLSLKMHQIEYLLDGCLPDDLSASLVFSATQLRRLQRRVDELEDEKAALRAAHKDLKREQAALLKDKAEKEKKVAELEARAHDVQMLKFGQVIDLELLDKVSSSRGTEDLKEELKKQEVSYARELAEWDAKIAARMDELVVLTRENTACLNAVSELTAAQRKLETGLTATRKGLFADPVQQRKAEVEERDALVQMVNAQAQEIDRLKTQLLALRRKDTSMYS